MAEDLELMPSSRTAYSRAWGSLSDADLVRHRARIAALFKAGVLDADWAQICDFTGVADLDGVSSAGVRAAAEENPWPRETVRAFIVATDEQFGMARMYQALGGTKTGDLCITRSAAEAAAFIERERIPAGSRELSEAGSGPRLELWSAAMELQPHAGSRPCLAMATNPLISLTIQRALHLATRLLLESP